MHTILTRLAALFAGFLLLSCSFAQKATRLFVPGDSANWRSYIPAHGVNKDPNKVFLFDEETLHVSGSEFGYLVTKESYSDFHLVLQFKWGEKKFPPRENAKRDGGILYHTDFYSGDKVWPRSLEYQIQEGDCGDFWMTDSTIILHKGRLTQPTNAFQAVKTSDAEKPHGEWNKAEVIVKDGNITHLLNDVVVNTGKLVNTSRGQILLQSEGAELYYKDIWVTDLE